MPGPRSDFLLTADSFVVKGFEELVGRAPPAKSRRVDLAGRPVWVPAALMHSLALNHRFVDGNKRVAAFAAIVFADSNGHEFLATPDELVATTLAVAEGEMLKSLASPRRRRRS